MTLVAGDESETCLVVMLALCRSCACCISCFSCLESLGWYDPPASRPNASGSGAFSPGAAPAGPRDDAKCSWDATGAPAGVLDVP